MGEEDTKKSPSAESPQSDGTKTPLTNSDGVAVTVEEAKYVHNPNGDSKIDVGIPPTFTGLTKEELMKYNNDPFWVRLRWFLFILFWLGWVAMLVAAIVIIVQTPGCKPPSELLWVEEEAMVHINPNNLPIPDELISKCNAMGISSVYFPDLIKSSNFEEMNYDVKNIIDAIGTANKQAVTDLPSSMAMNNPLYENATANNMIIDGNLNYAHENLTSLISTGIIEYWIEQGVKGFLMADTDTPEKKKFKEDLNTLIKEKKGAVGSDVVDLDPEINKFTPITFSEFLEENAANWTFNKFTPNLARGSRINKDDLRLINIGMFLYPGTPILKDYLRTDNLTADLLLNLGEKRSMPAIKFGETFFANNSENVIAYTRVHKGTPAYAVALNFNNKNETVSFEGTKYLGETGKVEISSLTNSTVYETSGKFDLKHGLLRPYEGLVIQFVAKYD